MKTTIRNYLAGAGHFLLGIATVAVVFSSCKKEKILLASSSQGHLTLLQTLRNSPQYSFFYEGLRRTGLLSIFDGKHPYTLLIPNNEAFGRAEILSVGKIDSLDSGYLKKLMLYHILPRRLYYSDIPQSVDNPFVNLLGDTLFFSKPVFWDTTAARDADGGRPRLHVNGDTIFSPFTGVPLDYVASDGVIQPLSSPLRIPQGTIKDFLLSDTNYRYFVAALRNFGLFDQLGADKPARYTVLAPKNQAFLNAGITFDSVNRYNPSNHNAYLFSVYIIPNSRIYFADIYDASSTGVYSSSSQSNHTNPGAYVYSKYGELSIGSVQNGNMYVLVGDTLSDVSAPNVAFPVNTLNLLGNQANIVIPDQTQTNGVVQSLDQIIIFPANEIKR